MEISRNIRIILLATALSLPILTYGNDDNPTTGGNTLFPGQPKKKRIPSLERIYYYYDAGQLELEPNFEYSALYVTVEDENTHRVWTGTATPEAPTVSAPEAPGSYYITTVTDQGKTFSGYFDL